MEQANFWFQIVDVLEGVFFSFMLIKLMIKMREHWSMKKSCRIKQNEFQYIWENSVEAFWIIIYIALSFPAWVLEQKGFQIAAFVANLTVSLIHIYLEIYRWKMNKRRV